ncbi:unnamed protein product [Clonostachys byssicola]|uniref:Fungal lipase-type domain-containing protein n=1 Tax=Clonostachys byssicola TaxID=160290 RepID=A0A9N9Y564_9HYPO|nr:unnamed protein product [Clonostachys byssicola]
MGLLSFLRTRPPARDQPKKTKPAKGAISHINDVDPKASSKVLTPRHSTVAVRRDKHHGDQSRKRTPYTGHHKNVSSPQLQLTPTYAPDHHRHDPQQQYRDRAQVYSGGGGGFAVSMVNLTRDAGALPNCNDGLAAWYGYSTALVGTTVSIFDEVSIRLNHILTQIDKEGMTGNEPDLFTCRSPIAAVNDCQALVRVSSADQQLTKPKHHHHEREPGSGRGKDRKRERSSRQNSSREDGCKEKPKKNAQLAGGVATAVVRGEYFSKVELYANSKLPASLPPFAVYFPTWPLLCLAAQYSQAVYERPQKRESEAHVSADWRAGTKAMVIKSVPMDHMRTIVFAVRGTASFMDWTVNLHAEPTSPSGFLDDKSNLCHSGFLTVARRMVKPVASRLKQLLEEDPSRSKYSLLITGHSAGGAVAALLYCHMLSRSKGAKTDLSQLTGSFKRVHCVTFGTPPISISPLMRPDRPDLKNSVFLSFINEGDPVVRADKAYVRNLLELLASPPPLSLPADKPSDVGRSSEGGRGAHTHPSPRLHKYKSRQDLKSKPNTAPQQKPVWPVPVSALKNAGRLVVLRSGPSDPRYRQHRDRMTVEERLSEGVVANTCCVEQLEGIIWGDPAAHLMNLYAGRIEKLAVKAVTVSDS